MSESWKARGNKDRTEDPHSDRKTERCCDVIVEMQARGRSFGYSAGDARHQTCGIERPWQGKDRTVNHNYSHRCDDEGDRTYHALVDEGANPIPTPDQCSEGVANNENSERRYTNDRWKEQEGRCCRYKDPRGAGKMEPVSAELMRAHQGSYGTEHDGARGLVEVHQGIDKD